MKCLCALTRSKGRIVRLVEAGLLDMLSEAKKPISGLCSTRGQIGNTIIQGHQECTGERSPTSLEAGGGSPLQAMGDGKRNSKSGFINTLCDNKDLK